MTLKPLLKKILWGLADLLLLSALGVYLLLRASLPKLDGAQALPGLSQRTVIERDGNGTVTITAHNAADSARADPEIAVAVMLVGAGQGGATAAPLARDVIAASL
mgnify:CR=1 FL=1